MTFAEFNQWVRDPTQADPIVYYEGYLARDREWSYIFGGKTFTSVNEPLAALAIKVYDAMRVGAVRLAQKRLGPNRYQYLAYKVTP